jgi:hypothetical protein
MKYMKYNLFKSKSLIVLNIFLLFVCFLFPIEAQTANNNGGSFSQIQSLIQTHQYTEAKVELLNHHLTTAKSYYALAFVNYQLGDFYSAKDSLNRAILIDPSISFVKDKSKVTTLRSDIEIAINNHNNVTPVSVSTAYPVASHHQRVITTTAATDYNVYGLNMFFFFLLIFLAVVISCVMYFPTIYNTSTTIPNTLGGYPISGGYRGTAGSVTGAPVYSSSPQPIVSQPVVYGGGYYNGSSFVEGVILGEVLGGGIGSHSTNQTIINENNTTTVIEESTPQSPEYDPGYNNDAYSPSAPAPAPSYDDGGSSSNNDFSSNDISSSNDGGSYDGGSNSSDGF